MNMNDSSARVWSDYIATCGANTIVIIGDGYLLPIGGW